MPNILIVEDEEAIRRVLKKVLSEDDSKNNILEASDGVEAINKIKTENLQLVICDIKMPKKDGLDVLNFLKSYDDKIPIIMISGHATVAIAVEATRLGAYEFIEKPFSKEKILNYVNRALESASLKKEKSTSKAPSTTKTGRLRASKVRLIKTK